MLLNEAIKIRLENLMKEKILVLNMKFPVMLELIPHY